ARPASLRPARTRRPVRPPGMSLRAPRRSSAEFASWNPRRLCERARFPPEWHPARVSLMAAAAIVFAKPARRHRRPSYSASMKKTLAVFLLARLAGSAHADDLDDYINTQMTRQHVPGLALAIMRHGQLVRAQGYGLANIEHNVPVHPDTVFETGA